VCSLFGIIVPKIWHHICAVFGISGAREARRLLLNI